MFILHIGVAVQERNFYWFLAALQSATRWKGFVELAKGMVDAVCDLPGEFS
jgi:hypothetical protein